MNLETDVGPQHVPSNSPKCSVFRAVSRGSTEGGGSTVAKLCSDGGELWACFPGKFCNLDIQMVHHWCNLDMNLRDSDGPDGPF